MIAGNRLFSFVLAALFAAGLACARMGAPTGGPEDKEPPRVESVFPSPDSSGVDRGSQITVTFSESVRRPEAERLLRLNPSAGRLFFEWQGRTVTIRPSDSLRADITYRLSLEPGLSDMHKVKAVTGYESWFSTGAQFSPGRITGQVLHRDSLVIGAFVSAALTADTSVVFDCRSDSSGRYSLPYLPFGQYHLRAFHDRNRNSRFDFTRDESADSLVEVTAEPLEAVLRLILADTTSPVLLTVSVTDSLRLNLAFDDYLDSLAVLAPDEFTLRESDSLGRQIKLSGASLDSTDHHRLLLTLSETLVAESKYWIRPAPVVNEAGLRLQQEKSTKEFTFKKESAPEKAGRPAGGRQR